MVLKAHCEITVRQLMLIAELKHFAWPLYSVYEHAQWMISNLNHEDLHCMYYHNSLQAYINVFGISANIDGEDVRIIGTGNLCSRDNLFGTVLYRQALNNYKKKFFMLGFCKTELLNYHTSLGWTKADKSKVDMPNVDLNTTEVITIGEFNTLKYLGNKF